ncbi:MAG: DUF58 domain-containing protein [Planctomycetota bacterium]|nr:MAG: DUF58 domain-containing protein [Planctomycetota bacterium]
MPDAPADQPAPRSADQPRVDPHLYLHPQTLARLGSFELRAKMIVEGVMSGMHRSPYAGVSVEFAQHRPYAPGDDIRRLDWKVYAKTDKLQIKQYQQETNLDLVVLVDASGSMNFGTRLYADATGSGRVVSMDGRPNWTKFDHATATAAALAYVTIEQGDRVGLVVYADEIRTMLPRSGRKATWRSIVDLLSTHPVDTQTDFARVMEQTLAKVTNRCLFAIVSDFFDDPERIRAALARVKHRGHDAILLQVLDRAETEFPFDDPARFEGLEHDGVLRLDPRAIREDYLAAFKGHIDALRKAARSFGFDHQVVSTHDWLGPPIAAMLAKRNAVIRRSGR